MQKRVYCLYRVSTAKQVNFDDKNQADIPVQRKACHDFAKKMGWSIIHEEQETGVSGFKLSVDHRDKLQLIKRHAEQKKFDILLVFMFDRLGRRDDETPFVVEWFVSHGVEVWSTQEGEQRFESHIDHLMNYIRYWQASGESKKIAIRTKIALGQMVQEGRFRGGVPPYGYRLVPSGVLNKRKQEVYKLEIDEDEAQVVRYMFYLCVGLGYGRYKIANQVSQQGMKTRTQSNWHEATVGHILHNITYIGVLRSAECQSEIIPELQIIDPETFEHAQQIMLQRSNVHRENRTISLNTSGQSLLSGNVFCGHCGGRLILTSNKSVRTNAAGERITYQRMRYICYNKTRHRVECDGQTGYTMHIVDDVVSELVKKSLNQMGIVEKEQITNILRGCSKATAYEALETARAALRTAKKEYDLVKAEIVKALQKESSFSVEVLGQLARDAEIKIHNAEKCVAKLRFGIFDEGINRISFKNLRWSDLFESCDVPAQKMVVGYLIPKIYIFRDYRICIEGSRMLSV